MARTISYTLTGIKIMHVVLDFAQERIIVEYFLLDETGTPHGSVEKAFFYRNVPPPPPIDSGVVNSDNYKIPDTLVPRLAELRNFIETKLLSLLD